VEGVGVEEGRGGGPPSVVGAPPTAVVEVGCQVIGEQGRRQSSWHRPETGAVAGKGSRSHPVAPRQTRRVAFCGAFPRRVGVGCG